MRSGSQRICNVCDIVNGLLLEMVIWYPGDQMIVQKIQIGRIGDQVSQCSNMWMISALGHLLMR